LVIVIIIIDGGNPTIVGVSDITIIDLVITIMISMIVMITHIGIIATTTTTFIGNTWEVSRNAHLLKQGDYHGWYGKKTHRTKSSIA
jgi:hypothetical protein